jgi:hypothetical protein
MFGKKDNANQLGLPPIASASASAREVLRVWSAPGSSQEVTLRTTWQDPGAWGLLLVDIANHAANAYQSEGHDRAEALARIRELFDAEWQHPTDTAKEIDPH